MDLTWILRGFGTTVGAYREAPIGGGGYAAGAATTTGHAQLPFHALRASDVGQAGMVRVDLRPMDWRDVPTMRMRTESQLQPRRGLNDFL
jgi:hypothetical protein